MRDKDVEERQCIVLYVTYHVKAEEKYYLNKTVI